MRKRNSKGPHLGILRDRIHSPQIAPFQFEPLRPSPRPWRVLQLQSLHHRLLPRLGNLPAQKIPALWVSSTVCQPMRLIRTPPGWQATRRTAASGKRIRSQPNHPRFGDTSSVLAMMAATAWDTAILSRQSMIRPMAKTLHSFRVLPAHSPGRRVWMRSFQPVRVIRIASPWQAAGTSPRKPGNPLFPQFPVPSSAPG